MRLQDKYPCQGGSAVPLWTGSRKLREEETDMKNYKLATLIDRLRLLDHAQEHRALSDVDAAGRLYLMCRQQIAAMEARRKRASRK